MRKDRLCQVAMSVCLLATGCFSYGPAPYYQPGTYGAVPHTAMGPRPISPMSPPAAVWIPATPQPSPLVGTTIPEPARANAPASADRFDDATNNKPVPEPADPGSRPQREETDSFGFREDDLNRREPRISRRARVTRPEDLELATEPDRVELSSGVESSRRLEEELPEVAAGLKSAEFTTRVMPDRDRPDERFGYDTEGYTWLQGIVEQGRNGTWYLVYSPTPDDTDQFGGEVTLKPASILKALRHRTLIRVEGHFDPNERDRRGKPLYEVDSGSIEVVRGK